MTDLPDIKIRAAVNFPPNALGGTGIEIAKVNGNFIVDLDYREISQAITVSAPDLATTFVLLWSQTTGVYQRISLANLKTTLGIP
jgi:hypothetical protein